MLYFKVISIYRGCVATCEKKDKKIYNWNSKLIKYIIF
jgi:hypothetical protein